MASDFNSLSYEKHQQSYTGKELHTPELFRNWFSRGTTDVWRHARKLGFIDPLIVGSKGATWLCIGDGRFGTSAMYIDAKGGFATATDIDISLLKSAIDNGLISRMSYQNAESITYDDRSFDFALCKEAFHHFPRPLIGFYEMLRVVRKAVVLIEPLDRFPAPIPQRMLQYSKNLVKRMIGREIVDIEKFNYEEIGNYIYTLSEREFEKAALALDLPAVAFLHFDDVYIPGVETEVMSGPAPLYHRICRELRLLSLKRKFGLASANYAVFVVFKEQPSIETAREMGQLGFRMRYLPRNPYQQH